MQSHSICAILLFGRRETVSRGRLGVASLAFQFAPVEKKGGREQGSVLRLERRWAKREGGQERRQTAHESRHGIFHIPQGNY